MTELSRASLGGTCEPGLDVDHAPYASTSSSVSNAPVSLSENAFCGDEPAGTTARNDLNPASDSNVTQMSKNAQKRLIKQQAWDAGKSDRRAREKVKRKEKTLERRHLIHSGVIERPLKKKVLDRKPFNARVVIDCGFDDKMTEKEIKSMSSQLGFCYASNRSSANPVHLLVTSLDGQLRKRMNTDLTAQHELWKNVEWWEEGYEGLWDPAEHEIKIGTLKGSRRAIAHKEDIIYLTGDSPNLLTEIEEHKTYILGGIVDRNRYKLLCYNKANGHNVNHARLPIGEFLPEMPTRKVLTVNQVNDIILKWIEKRDWKDAFVAVMPERKYTDGYKAAKKAKKQSVFEANEERSEEESNVDA